MYKRQHLTDALVKYKKYFYVLRPILACRWIENKACPPPVLFTALAAETLEDDMRAAINQLVETKKQMTESEKAPRIDHLNTYIEKQLAYFKTAIDAMADDRTADWEALNEVFFRTL